MDEKGHKLCVLCVRSGLFGHNEKGKLFALVCMHAKSLAKGKRTDVHCYYKALVLWSWGGSHTKADWCTGALCFVCCSHHYVALLGPPSGELYKRGEAVCAGRLPKSTACSTSPSYCQINSARPLCVEHNFFCSLLLPLLCTTACQLALPDESCCTRPNILPPSLLMMASWPTPSSHELTPTVNNKDIAWFNPTQILGCGVYIHARWHAAGHCRPSL